MMRVAVLGRVGVERADDGHVLIGVLGVGDAHGRLAGAAQVARPVAALGGVEHDAAVVVGVGPDDDGLDRAVRAGDRDVGEVLVLHELLGAAFELRRWPWRSSWVGGQRDGCVRNIARA